MKISTNSEKSKIIDKYTPKSKHFRNTSLAFLFGGYLCLLGEALFLIFEKFNISEKDSLTLTSLSLITLAALLTLFGVFDMIAKYAGAGTLVPITGFSNAVVSEAMDAKSEGYVLGVGAKIFTVSGPVILFGISAGVIYGFIYFLMKII
jgi:stage V sporulation protein AC